MSETQFINRIMVIYNNRRELNPARYITINSRNKIIFFSYNYKEQRLQSDRTIPKYKYISQFNSRTFESF